MCLNWLNVEQDEQDKDFDLYSVWVNMSGCLHYNSGPFAACLATGPLGQGGNLLWCSRVVTSHGFIDISTWNGRWIYWVKRWVSNWNFDTFDEWRKLRPQLATSRTKVADDFRRLWLWMAKRWYTGKVKWLWGLLQGAFSCCVLSILFSRVVVIVLIAWVCFMLRRCPGQCIQHRADNVQVLRGPLCFLPTCSRCTGGKGSTSVPHWPWPEFAQLMASEMAETKPRCWLFILFRASSSSPSKVCAENIDNSSFGAIQGS